jgi:hypothetical protein
MLHPEKSDYPILYLGGELILYNPVVENRGDLNTQLSG